jgi:hypothetical protein
MEIVASQVPGPAPEKLLSPSAALEATGTGTDLRTPSGLVASRLG